MCSMYKVMIYSKGTTVFGSQKSSNQRCTAQCSCILLKAVKHSPFHSDTSGKGHFLISIMTTDKDEAEWNQ